VFAAVHSLRTAAHAVKSFGIVPMIQM